MSDRKAVRSDDLPSSRVPVFQQEVPRITWESLGGEDDGVLLRERRLTLMYTGFFRDPKGSFKYVLYKTQKPITNTTIKSLEHEARVLSTLRGVQGVPTLYGLTHPPKVALAMSFCPGKPLRDFLTPDTARTYLLAVQKTCLVLKNMHEAGVLHNNVHLDNILVNVREGMAGMTDCVSVSVVGMESATIGLQVFGNVCFGVHDMYCIVVLLQIISRYLFGGSLPLNLCRCKSEIEVLSRLNPLQIDWMVILVALCRILHDERPEVCSVCAREIWDRFRS